MGATALAAKVVGDTTEGLVQGSFSFKRAQWVLSTAQVFSEVSIFSLEGARWWSDTTVWCMRVSIQLSCTRRLGSRIVLLTRKDFKRRGLMKVITSLGGCHPWRRLR